MKKETGVLPQKSARYGAGYETPELIDLCRYAFELSPLAMVAVEGMTHIVRYINPAFAEISGKSQKELLGSRFCDIVREGATNRCEELLDRVFRVGKTETLADQKHGASLIGVYWSYTAWAMLDATNNPLGVMIQITDTSLAHNNLQQAALMNEALMIHGLKQGELVDALSLREQTVKINEALTQSLTEQNALAVALNVRLQRAVQETHHRVKNNLQIVAALAEIQKVEGSETVPAAALERIAAHVRALASLHDVLTLQARDSGLAESVDTDVSLERLVTLLQTSVGSRRIVHEIAPITLPIQKSASLSLLISELVSNAVKHGAGDITILLQQEGDTARLTVSDAGKGFPPDFNPAAGGSAGMELIASFARFDLNGSLTFAASPKGGAAVTVTFPVDG